MQSLHNGEHLSEHLSGVSKYIRQGIDTRCCRTQIPEWPEALGYFTTIDGGVTHLDATDVATIGDAAFARGVSGDDIMWSEPKTGCQLQDHKVWVELICYELGHQQRERKF